MRLGFGAFILVMGLSANASPMELGVVDFVANENRVEIKVFSLVAQQAIVYCSQSSCSKSLIKLEHSKAVREVAGLKKGESVVVILERLNDAGQVLFHTTHSYRIESEKGRPIAAPKLISYPSKPH
jgi:hypothetical protein